MAIETYMQRKDKDKTGGMVGDKVTTAGVASGSRFAEGLYGQDRKQTASQTQDIVKRRKQRLEGGSPGQSELRRARNRQVAVARARGASPAEVAQIENTAQRSIIQESFNQEGQALGDYQSLIGNILRGQSSLALGFGGLAKAGQAPDQAKRNEGITVICTALFMKKDITRKEYVPCVKYGLALKCHEPEFHDAYLKFYTPIADAYLKWGWFRVLSRPFFRPWARHISDNNVWGRVVHSIGVLPVHALALVRRCYGHQLQSS